MGIGNRALGGGIRSRPLVGAGGALGQLPLVLEQGGEEGVVPLHRGRGPDPLEPARPGVAAVAVAERVLPAQPLQLERGGLGIETDVIVGDGAVGLAERVAAGDQRDRLLVVHRHPAERLADVAGRGDRIRVAVRPLRVDVDQAHLDGAERLLEVAVAAVALIVQPHLLGAPIDVLGLPDVFAPAAEPERLEAHRLQRDVAGEDHQVGPGDLVAVLLLDRPEQTPGLVEAHVVGPAVERSEALGAGAATAAAVGDPVRARAVPCHPDEERPVVAEVRRPPRLRIRHQREQILSERVKIERPERLRVIELLAHRIGLRGVVLQDLQVELIRPPVSVAPASIRGVDDRALALALGDSHVDSAPSRSLTFGGCLYVVLYGSTTLSGVPPFPLEGSRDGVSAHAAGPILDPFKNLRHTNLESLAAGA